MNEIKKINKDRIKLGGIEYRKCLEILGKLNSMSITLKDVKNKAIEANKPYELVEDVLKEVEGFKKYVEELLKEYQILIVGRAITKSRDPGRVIRMFINKMGYDIDTYRLYFDEDEDIDI